MSIPDELQKLDDLRRRGVLSLDEFEIAKQKILAGPATPFRDDQFEEIKTQNEIAQLDREWELDRENYMVTGKHGHKRIPSQTGSLLGGVVIVAFGIFWTIGAASMPSFHDGGFANFFPLFGVLFIVFGAVMSIVSFTKAGKYNDAHQQYKRRRRAMLASNRQDKRSTE